MSAIDGSSAAIGDWKNENNKLGEKEVTRDRRVRTCKSHGCDESGRKQFRKDEQNINDSREGATQDAKVETGRMTQRRNTTQEKQQAGAVPYKKTQQKRNANNESG